MMEEKAMKIGGDNREKWDRVSPWGLANGEITCRPIRYQILERGYFRSGLLTGYVIFNNKIF